MEKMLLCIMLLSLTLLSGCQLFRSEPPRVAILGDSYSTFQGCIPQGNAVYYPREGGGNDVVEAQQCWWSQVIANIGGTLERNESYSGSTICHTGYSGRDASDRSFITRVGRLGNPNLILVCGATNDSWANVPIGEYRWSAWTKPELYTFRPAMAKMLVDLKALYPKARIIFILNSELKADINDSVHEICAHYGVQCVDLVDIDKQMGHPSIAGMKAFAAQVTEAIRK